MQALIAGRARLAVEEALLEAARPRCDVGPWRSREPGPVSCRVLREPVPRPATLLDPTQPELGTFRVEEERVGVDPSADPRGPEAGIKAGFALAAFLQGGLLVHSAAFAWPGVAAALVIGPSGAGKSTLAALAVGAGATLLSDETNLVLPGREVAGTPFRSDLALAPSPGPAPLGAVLTLTHGQAESLRPVPVHRAVGHLLAQVYPLPLSGFRSAALIARAEALLARVPALDFTFRKAPEAAAWLRSALEALPESP